MDMYKVGCCEGRLDVLFVASPVFFPFCFAQHTWFLVCDEDNEMRRYEVMEIVNEEQPRLGHINVDLFGSLLGMPWLPWLGSVKRFNGYQLYRIDGERAMKVKAVLEEDLTSYPCRDDYGFYPGPNSNTFTQWVLDRVDVDYKLSWRAIGKSYSVRD